VTNAKLLVIPCIFSCLLLACGHTPLGDDRSADAGGGGGDGEETPSVLEIIKDPLAMTVLSDMVSPGTIAANGASGSNIDYERGEPDSRFDVADQRHCWQAIARGVAEDNTYYIERGFKAMDYAFAYQETAGNFGESGWFETMGFLESVLRSHALMEDSKYGDASLPELEKNLDGMEAGVEWLAETMDEEFSDHWEQAPDYLNVVAGTAVTFQLMGLRAGNDDWSQMAREFVELSLSNQWENGVFPEAGGYDSSYQAVTLWHLMIYLLYSGDVEVNTQIRQALELGWEWELSRIAPDGEVITDGNTRTGPEGEIWRGERKQVNYPEVMMSLIYWSYVSGDEEILDLAETVHEYALHL
jgi:hypothetical protein